MKRVILVGLLVIAAAAGGYAYYLSQRIVPQPPAVVAIPMDTAIRIQRGEIQLIDVRDLALAKKGMPTIARHVPVVQFEQALSQISRRKQIAVLCETAECGEKLANRAAQLGYRSTFLKSFEEWKKLGLPVRSNW